MNEVHVAWLKPNWSAAIKASGLSLVARSVKLLGSSFGIRNHMLLSGSFMKSTKVMLSTLEAAPPLRAQLWISERLRAFSY
ncbi:MAG TPA: hypothetical protein VJ866_11390 [Pyrinomonadaceae bacterium]|nr:hypothetical protein [Pyrinomonadaceae bacterium]